MNDRDIAIGEYFQVLDHRYGKPERNRFQRRFQLRKLRSLGGRPVQLLSGISLHPELALGLLGFEIRNSFLLVFRIHLDEYPSGSRSLIGLPE